MEGNLSAFFGTRREEQLENDGSWAYVEQWYMRQFGNSRRHHLIDKLKVDNHLQQPVSHIIMDRDTDFAHACVNGEKRFQGQPYFRISVPLFSSFNSFLEISPQHTLNYMESLAQEQHGTGDTVTRDATSHHGTVISSVAETTTTDTTIDNSVSLERPGPVALQDLLTITEDREHRMEIDNPHKRAHSDSGDEAVHFPSLWNSGPKVNERKFRRLDWAKEEMENTIKQHETTIQEQEKTIETLQDHIIREFQVLDPSFFEDIDPSTLSDISLREDKLFAIIASLKR
ncbi:hypothetical protein VKT23_020354 [Stygiomarasmius scandens]|uniref:Uncharacterized protein n=1 Tax=Marasmiellus scandens TaxID=2682957 RepID=A0ABR1IMP7_9AGAR